MKEEERIRHDFKKYRRKNPFPQPLRFNRKYFGDVVNEVSVSEWAGNELGAYVKVIQSIRKKGIMGKPEEWLRFGYYKREKKGKGFRWSSRTALLIEKSLWRRLMRDAERRDFW